MLHFSVQILIINQSNSKNYQKIRDEGGKIALYWKWFTAHNINTKKILFIVMKMLDWDCLIQEEAEKEVKEKYHTD